MSVGLRNIEETKLRETVKRRLAPKNGGLGKLAAMDYVALLDDTRRAKNNKVAEGAK